MDGARSRWALGLMVLVLSLGSPIVNAAIPCQEALAIMAPCTQFLLGNPPPTPSAACCAGAQKLDKLALGSSEERKNLCQCFVAAAKSIPIKPERVQILTQICQLKVTIPSDPKVDCSKIGLNNEEA